MTPRRHLADLDLSAVVAAFDGLGSRVGARIEDDHGRCLAASGTPVEGYRARADITVHDEPAGRVVLSGSADDAALLQAVAESLAAALQVAIAAGTAPGVPAPSSTLIEQELAQSRRLQRTFVSLVPPEVPGYDIATYYEAAREVGGDFFDLFRLRRRGRPLSLVIADVTGKGIAAALLMAFARPVMHAAIDHTNDPALALERTNAVFVRERRTSLFITAISARLDVATGRVRMANAGHEPPLLIPGDGSAPTLVLGSGVLLGAFEELQVPTVEIALAPGDILLFYTDGVTDAKSEDGRRFDEPGLFAAVESARGGTAQDVVDAITAALDRFAGRGEPADDITMVALGRRRGR